MLTTLRDVFGTIGVMSLIAATAIFFGSSHARATQPPPVIVCESGSGYRAAALEDDPYYVETMDCHAGTSNGPTVQVIIID